MTFRNHNSYITRTRLGCQVLSHLHWHSQCHSVLAMALFFVACAPHGARGAEAWWLEMPKSVQEALLKRISAGKTDDAVAAVALLPELVKSGKVREIERFTEGPDGNATPAHHKERSLKVSKGQMKGQTLITGASYGHSAKLQCARELRIRTKGNGLGADLRIVTLSPLGKTWQPIFCLVIGDTARVLLEREPRAEVISLMPAAILEIQSKGEQPISASWLGEKDPFLTRETIPERKTGPLKPGCGLEFEDTVMTDRGPSGQMISWGHTLRCALLSKRSLGLELSWTGSPRVKRANYREAHAALTLDEPAIESAETLVFKDLAERSGEWAAEENGQTTGKATLKMMRIPSLSQ